MAEDEITYLEVCNVSNPLATLPKRSAATTAAAVAVHTFFSRLLLRTLLSRGWGSQGSTYVRKEMCRCVCVMVVVG